MTTVEIVRGVRPKRKIPNFSFPRKQTPNNQVWGLVVDGDLASILHVVISDDYLLFNYSYTYPEFQRRGYSHLLRNAAIEYARDQGLARVVSVPLPGANSEPLLRKMGFEKVDEHYYLNLN